MLFPIGDDNSDRRTTPFVNYLLIAINILVFVFLQGMGENTRFTYAYSTVPEEILKLFAGGQPAGRTIPG